MTLRILLDQNIPSQVCDFVRKHKPDWEVRHVSDVGLRGTTDDSIFRWAQRDGSIIVTFDEDFADARMYPVGSHAGVIRLRVWPTTIENTETALARLFDALADEDVREEPGITLGDFQALVTIDHVWFWKGCKVRGCAWVSHVDLSAIPAPEPRRDTRRDRDEWPAPRRAVAGDRQFTTGTANVVSTDAASVCEH